MSGVDALLEVVRKLPHSGDPNHWQMQVSILDSFVNSVLADVKSM
jgi:hypothetical protein